MHFIMKNILKSNHNYTSKQTQTDSKSKREFLNNQHPS
jgi:hypothetical protein